MLPSDVSSPLQQEDIQTTLYNLIISQLKYDYHHAAATSIELSHSLSPLPASNDLLLIISALNNSALLFEQAQHLLNMAPVRPPELSNPPNSHLQFIDTKLSFGLSSDDLSPLRPPRTVSVLATIPPLYFPPHVPQTLPPLTKNSFNAFLTDEDESSNTTEQPVLYNSELSKLAKELLNVKEPVAADAGRDELYNSEMSKLVKELLNNPDHQDVKLKDESIEPPVVYNSEQSEIVKELLKVEELPIDVNVKEEHIEQPVLHDAELLDVIDKVPVSTEVRKDVKEEPNEPPGPYDPELPVSKTELLNDAVPLSASIKMYSHELELEVEKPVDDLPKKASDCITDLTPPTPKVGSLYATQELDEVKVERLCWDNGEEDSSGRQTPDNWSDTPDEVTDCQADALLPDGQNGPELGLDYHGNVISPDVPEDIIKDVPHFSDHEKNIILVFLQSQVTCSCKQFQTSAGKWIPQLLSHTVPEILQALLGASSVDDILLDIMSDVDDDFTDSIEHYTESDKDGNLINMLRISSDHCGLFYRKKPLILNLSEKEEIVSILAEKWRTRLDFWTEAMLRVDMPNHIYNVEEILFATFGKNYKDYVGEKEGVRLMHLKLTQSENQKVVSLLSEGWQSQRSAHTKISELVPMVARCSLDAILFAVFKDTINDNVEIKQHEFGVELLKLKSRSNAVRQVGSLILNDHEKNIIVARLSTMFYYHSEIPDRFSKQLPKLVHFSTNEVLEAIFGDEVDEFIEDHPTRRGRGSRSIRLDRESDYNSVLNKPPLILNKPQKHSIVDCLDSEWLLTTAFIYNYTKLNGNRIRNLNYYTTDEILFAVFGKDVDKCIEEMVTQNGNLAIRIKDMVMEDGSGDDSDSSSIVFEDSDDEASKTTKTVYSFITYNDYIPPTKHNHPHQYSDSDTSDESEQSDAEDELIACDDMKPLEVLELSKPEKQIVVCFLQTKLRSVCSEKIFKRVVAEKIPRVIFYSVDEILWAISGEHAGNEIERFTVNNLIDKTANKMLKARSEEALFHDSKEAIKIDETERKAISKLLDNKWITAASFKAKAIKLDPALSNCSVDDILFVIFGQSSDRVIRETVSAIGEIVMSLSLQFTPEEQRIVVSFLCEGWKQCNYAMSYFDKHIPKVRDCILDEVLVAAFGSEVLQNVETDCKDGVILVRLKRNSTAIKDIGMLHLSDIEKNEITARLSTRFYDGKAFCEGFASRFTKVQFLTTDQLLYAIFGERVSEFVEKHPTKPDSIRLKRGSDYNRLLNKRSLVLSSSEISAVTDALTWKSWVVGSNFHSMVIQKVSKLKSYTAEEILTAVFGTNLINFIEEKINNSGEVAFKLKRHRKVSEACLRQGLVFSFDEQCAVESLLANWISETNLIKNIEQLIPRSDAYDLDEILRAAFGENVSEFIDESMTSRNILMRLKLRLNEDEKQQIRSLFLNTPGGFRSKAMFVSNKVRKMVPKIANTFNSNEILQAVFGENLDEALETLIGVNGQECVRLKGDTLNDLKFNAEELQAIYSILSDGWILTSKAHKDMKKKIRKIYHGLDINTILLSVFKDRLSYYVGSKVDLNRKAYLRLQHFELEDHEPDLSINPVAPASNPELETATDGTLIVSQKELNRGSRPLGDVPRAGNKSKKKRKKKEEVCVKERLATQALLEPLGQLKGGLILNENESKAVRSVLALGNQSNPAEHIYTRIKQKVLKTNSYCLNEILTAAFGETLDTFVKCLVDPGGKSLIMFNPNPDLKLTEKEVQLVFSCLSVLCGKSRKSLRKEITAKIPRTSYLCLEVVLFAAFGDRIPYYIDAKSTKSSVELRLKQGVDCDQVLRNFNLNILAERTAETASVSESSEEWEDQVNMAGPSNAASRMNNSPTEDPVQEKEGLLSDDCC